MKRTLLGILAFGVGLAASFTYFSNTNSKIVFATQSANPQSGPVNCATQTVIPQVECEALVELYNTTDGAAWTTNTNRLTTNNPCKWFGVRCAGKRVTEINLNNNNLVNELPSSIGVFTALRLLLLNNNTMCGALPETLTNLVNLKKADFRNNNFLTNGYSVAMMTFLSQSFISWLPQVNPQTCDPVVLPELSIAVNNEDDETDDPKYVLGGDGIDGPYVAAFELLAQNGDVLLRDFKILVSGPGAPDFNEAVVEVMVFDGPDPLGLLQIVNVTNNNEIIFDNVDLEIPEGDKDLYVKIDADLIGSDYEGTATDDITFSFVATDVEDLVSGTDIVPTYDGVNQTLPSNPFMVVAAKFIDADFVLSAAGQVVDTSVSNGSDVNIGILQLTADTRSNTQQSPAGDLDMYVDQLRFITTNTQYVTNYELIRIGNGPTTYIPGTTNGNVVQFYFGTSSLATREFTSSEVGYYLVRADIDAGSENTSVKLSLENLNGGTPTPIQYTLSDNTNTYTQLRIGVDEIQSQTVSVVN